MFPPVTAVDHSFQITPHSTCSAVWVRISACRRSQSTSPWTAAPTGGQRAISGDGVPHHVAVPLRTSTTRRAPASERPGVVRLTAAGRVERRAVERDTRPPSSTSTTVASNVAQIRRLAGTAVRLRPSRAFCRGRDATFAARRTTTVVRIAAHIVPARTRAQGGSPQCPVRTEPGDLLALMIVSCIVPRGLRVVLDDKSSSSDSGTKEYSIAFVGPLTGDSANLGINIRNGAKTAVQEFNDANPNYKITLKEFDTQGDPAQAPTVLDKYINDDKILGLVGPAFSGETKAVLPHARGERARDGERVGHQHRAAGRRQGRQGVPPGPPRRRRPGRRRGEVPHRPR